MPRVLISGASGLIGSALVASFESRGNEVIAAVRQYRPGLVLLDLSLPDVPGNEILRQLDLNPETNQVPIIVVSAYTEQLRRVPQVRAVVNKPFDISTLLEAVDLARQNGQDRV